MPTRFLTALPVFNEVRHAASVLDQVLRYSDDVLVVDDGSTDGTDRLLAARGDVRVATHRENQGYGAALRTAFAFAVEHEYDVIVTIDCDGQHEPQRIAQFVEACGAADIVSGSRYLTEFHHDSAPPAERRAINERLTREINRRLGLTLTDAFCGFKAYRVGALKSLTTSDPGYAMPLELWVRAAHARLNIVELPVPRIYLEEDRSFGGALDDGDTRLAHYYQVLDRAEAALRPMADGTGTCRPAEVSAGEGTGRC
jgi:glycosyltransferase involved in cell wall biosynthesis